MYKTISYGIERLIGGEDSLTKLFKYRVYKTRNRKLDSNKDPIWERWDQGEPLYLIIGYAHDLSPD